MNRVYTAEKAGMGETDKQRILEIVEKSTTAEYKEHMENKELNYQRRLHTLKLAINKMSQQDWFEATSGVGF